jgi:hypothetical protein
MARYSDEQLQKYFDDWVAGVITRESMSQKEWSAFKRRLNKRGFKKRPEHFKMTNKLGPEEKKRRRRIYMKIYREKQKALK